MNTSEQPTPPKELLTVPREQPPVARGPEAYFLPVPAGSPSSGQPPASASPGVLTAAEQVEQAARRLEQEKEQARQLSAAPGPAGPPNQDEMRQREGAKRAEEERQRRSEEERSKEAYWRGENERVLAQLREALASYQTQLCNDMRGAQTLYGGGESMHARYQSARSLARDFEERARRAEARSFVDLRWNEFPDPEPPGPVDPLRVSFMRYKWKCPKVY